MNAIRRDEIPDNLHSIYVDQWDWERGRDRTPAHNGFSAGNGAGHCRCRLRNTADELRWKFPELKRVRLSRDITFITTQQLEDPYPALSPKERETAFTKAHGTVCLLQIGGRLGFGRAARRPRARL